MGKRELAIICAFVVVGVVAYQFAAPPGKPGERGFSFSQLFNNVRREIRANASSAHITKNGSFPAPAAMTEIRVSTARSVPLTIIGEKRDDISYEMPVESTGPDEKTAQEWAGKVEVRQDDLGTAVALSTYFPEEGTQNASLTLHVPARLAVRVENSGKIQVSQVASVELRNPAGEVSLSGIGAITGSHRSGDLTVNGATTVNLSLSSSRARIRNVTQGITINGRNGECWIADSTGDLVTNVTNVELTVNMFKNSLKVNGDGGQVKVLHATNKVSIDVRRMQVEMEVGAGAGDDITAITTEETIRLTLGADANATIDAITVGGEITASDFGLQSTGDKRERKLMATLGKGGARLVLRNSRDDIVISKRK